MYRVLDLITSFIMLSIVLINGADLVKNLGGMTVLLPFCAVIFVYSHAEKNMQSELSIIIFWLLTIVGFNELASLEIKRIYPFSYILIGFIILSLFFIASFIAFNLKTLDKGVNNQEISNSPLYIQTKKQIFFRMIFCPLFGFALVVVTGIFLSDILRNGTFVIVEGWKNYGFLSLFCLVIFILLTLIDLRGIDKKYFYFLMNDMQKYKMPNANAFKVTVAILLIFSFVTEIFRGFWIVWVVSISLSFVSALTCWISFKYRFEKDITPAKSIEDDHFSYTGYFLKMIVITGPIALIYCIALAVLL